MKLYYYEAGILTPAYNIKINVYELVETTTCGYLMETPFGVFEMEGTRTSYIYESVKAFKKYMKRNGTSFEIVRIE